jgi:hypothetical protein
MDIREECTIEIEDNLYEAFTETDLPYTEFKLKHFERTPVDPVGIDLMPCVLILEGEDNIKKRTNRTYAGFPVSRAFELMVEVWDFDRVKVKSMYFTARKAVLKKGGTLLNGAIREDKVFGPFTALPEGALGMRIVFELVYEDKEL